jgi:hypothetical protein
MKIAITHNEGQAIVSFSEEKFRALLKEYSGDDKVLDRIITDLKKELLKL